MVNTVKQDNNDTEDTYTNDNNDDIPVPRKRIRCITKNDDE